jgi:hypothetical protein
MASQATSLRSAVIALEDPGGGGVRQDNLSLDRFKAALFRADLKDRLAREALDRALIVVVSVIQIYLKPATQTVDFHIFSSESSPDNVW